MLISQLNWQAVSSSRRASRSRTTRASAGPDARAAFGWWRGAVPVAVGGAKAPSVCTNARRPKTEVGDVSRDVERVPRDSSERPGVGTRHFCVGIYGNVRAAARALRRVVHNSQACVRSQFGPVGAAMAFIHRIAQPSPPVSPVPSTLNAMVPLLRCASGAGPPCTLNRPGTFGRAIWRSRQPALPEVVASCRPLRPLWLQEE